MEYGKGEIQIIGSIFHTASGQCGEQLAGHVLEAETLGVFNTRLDTVLDTYSLLGKLSSRSTLERGKLFSAEHCWGEWPVLTITLLCYVI